MNRRLTDALLNATVAAAAEEAVARGATLRFGTVLAADDATGTLTCDLAGTTLYGVPFMGTFAPQVDDTVWLLHQDSIVVAIGAWEGHGGWDDLRTPLLRATTGSGTPTLAAFRGGLYAYSFSQTTMNELFFDVQLPHGWVPGTALHPHIHWSPGNSTNTGVVRWGLEYAWANAVNPPGNVFPAPTTVYVEQAAGGTPYQQQIASFPAIDGAGMRLSSVLLCRLFRDAAHVNDTFTTGAFGISSDFHHLVSSVGSSDEFPTI